MYFHEIATAISVVDNAVTNNGSCRQTLRHYEDKLPVWELIANPSRHSLMTGWKRSFHGNLQKSNGYEMMCVWLLQLTKTYFPKSLCAFSIPLISPGIPTARPPCTPHTHTHTHIKTSDHAPYIIYSHNGNLYSITCTLHSYRAVCIYIVLNKNSFSRCEGTRLKVRGFL